MTPFDAVKWLHIGCIRPPSNEATPCKARGCKILAERHGFEPWVEPGPTLVFETSPFDHSGISPLFFNPTELIQVELGILPTLVVLSNDSCLLSGYSASSTMKTTTAWSSPLKRGRRVNKIASTAISTGICTYFRKGPKGRPPPSLTVQAPLGVM